MPCLSGTLFKKQNPGPEPLSTLFMFAWDFCRKSHNLRPVLLNIQAPLAPCASMFSWNIQMQSGPQSPWLCWSILQEPLADFPTPSPEQLFPMTAAHLKALRLAAMFPFTISGQHHLVLHREEGSHENFSTTRLYLAAYPSSPSSSFPSSSKGIRNSSTTLLDTVPFSSPGTVQEILSLVHLFNFSLSIFSHHLCF